AIERIQQAASGLDERIAEIDDQEHVLNELDAKLTELTSHLMGGASSPQSKTQDSPAAAANAAMPEAA
ncbi:MAG: dynamin family protein, partial [Polaromonas sp.]